MTVLNLTINANNYDGYSNHTASFNSGSPVALVGNAGGTSIYKFDLFSGVSGLSGATINSATYSVNRQTHSGSPQLKIRANDAESPTHPTNAAAHGALTRTTAGVDWDGGWSAGYNNKSCTSVIQELADSYDPSAILMLLDDDGSASNNYGYAWTRENGPATAAKLDIDYTEAASGSEGTIAQTLPSVTQSASGELLAKATSQQQLPPLTQSAQAAVAVRGTISHSLPKLSQAATGTVLIVGNAEQTLPAVTQTAQAAVPAHGTVESTLPALTQVAAGTTANSGEIDQTLPSITQSASGAILVTGNAASLLPALTQAAVGAITIHGEGAQTLPSLTQLATAAVLVYGQAAQTLPSIVQAAAGSAIVGGDGASLLPSIRQAAVGIVYTPVEHLVCIEAAAAFCVRTELAAAFSPHIVAGVAHASCEAGEAFAPVADCGVFTPNIEAAQGGCHAPVS